jgi:hypothetical protein
MDFFPLVYKIVLFFLIFSRSALVPLSTVVKRNSFCLYDLHIQDSFAYFLYSGILCVFYNI